MAECLSLINIITSTEDYNVINVLIFRSDVHVISESQVSSSSDRTSKDPDSQNIDDKSPDTGLF